MYDVILIKLSDDARSVAAEPGKTVRRGLSGEQLRDLLSNFCALDPVDNAAADPEIRVQAAAESFLVRAGQKKLILYRADDRESPAQVLTVDEVMAEIDGTARAARSASWSTPAQSQARLPEPVAAPAVPRSHPIRLATLAAVAAVLASGLFLLRPAPSGVPADFRPLPASEATARWASMAGVYMTGTRPGQHGIVITRAGDLRLFELRAVRAPGVVYASARWGRTGASLALATDQPGGLILIPSRDILVYCGETYRRIP
jgi:hypothetical protein